MAASAVCSGVATNLRGKLLAAAGRFGNERASETAGCGPAHRRSVAAGGCKTDTARAGAQAAAAATPTSTALLRAAPSSGQGRCAKPVLCTPPCRPLCLRRDAGPCACVAAPVRIGTQRLQANDNDHQLACTTVWVRRRFSKRPRPLLQRALVEDGEGTINTPPMSPGFRGHHSTFP